MNPQINEQKLTEAQRQQLELYYQTQRQLTTLKDIADMLQSISGQLDDKKPLSDMGVLLTDIRESLASLNAKEAPDSPDYAKPVVEAVSELQKTLSAAIKAIDVKPNVQVSSPDVNVSPPAIDLSGIESALGAMPKAFEKAIKLIDIPELPQTDFQPLLEAWQGISEQLLSIENATRAKPLPGSMAVSNLNEIPRQGLIPVAFSRLTFSSADSNGNYRVGTVKNGVDIVGSLALTYDASSNLTDIQFTAA